MKELNNEIKEVLATRINIILEDRKLNRSEFADRLGCNKANVTRWLTKKITPSVSGVLRMCKVLQITPNDILDGLF